MAMTAKEFIDRYNAMRDRADRIRWMVWNRANEECQKAGLGTIGCQLDNALISASEGKPWVGVNYHHARKAKWLLDRQFAALDVCNKWYDRKYREVYKR